MAEENVRPWGKYEIVGKTKIITVKPNQKLSLQYHQNRDEFWKILSGEGEVYIGETKFQAKEGDTFQIKKTEKHRIIAGENGIVFLEIATGLVDEDDIVRIEDDYGRIE